MAAAAVESPVVTGAISIEGLTKVYERITGREIVRTYALNGVDLLVRPQEFVSLVGPSGCGKTTVLKVIAGLLDATAGLVHVNGTAVTGTGVDRGVVFQQPSLLPWRTVRQNILESLRFAGVARAQRALRADKYLDMVGLSGFVDHYPGELSGGMQQRVGIARALALEPSVLLMDEPFGALDAITRQHMQTELMRIWAQEKRSVLFVTHSIEEALLLSDRVVVMADGAVRADVAVPIERPRSRTELINDPAARQLRAQLESLL
ncbi:ABC transporter ATP-binding protein [Mycolicibacterium litorale]|uniref:ABC transporter ATP-binding protein n=1 Tax=Mycolicibacterium litorale TaxID=758802 RepID=UPI003CEDE38E